MEDGVWRTVSGRKIFIREGQSLSDAMKESGKFNSKERYQEKQKEEKEKAFKDLEKKFGKKYLKTSDEELLKKAEELDKEANGPLSTLSYEEIQEARKEIKYLKEEYHNRTAEKRETQQKEKFEQQKKLEKEQSLKRVSKITDVDIKNLNRTELNNEEKKLWSGTLDSDILQLENPELYISNDSLESLVSDNKIITTRRQNLQDLYDNDKITSKQYDKYEKSINEYEENVRDILYSKVEQKGYQFEELPNGKMVYSQRVNIQTGYIQMLDYLDRNKIKYEISRSTNAGIVPSIYIKDEEGDIVARIGNHANSNMNHLEKVYENKDYLDWKEKIIKKIF